MALAEVAIERVQKIEPAALLIAADGLGRGEIENRCALAAEQRALVSGGEESGAPVFPAAQHFAGVGQDNEGRQVLIGGAQSVSDPRAHATAARRESSRCSSGTQTRRGSVHQPSRSGT